MMAMPMALGGADLLQLFGHFLTLSLLAVGGAITTAPDMHRYLVVEHGWLTDVQFTTAIALAQAAPGPNILFVAVLGWSVGGPAGVTATMAGILLPSSLLTFFASRWGTARRHTRGIRAFTTGMAPVTIGLLLATGWVIGEPYLRDSARAIGAVLLIVFSGWAIARTSWSPLWLVATGAAVGALGWA